MTPTSGKKRQRDSSSPEPPGKRRALSVDQAPSHNPRILDPSNKKSTLNHSNPLTPDDTWYCPKCGRRCWLCNLSSPAPLEQVNIREEEGLERARMLSDNTTSNTENSSVASSSKKRKQKQEHYALLGMRNVGPRDKDFKDRILDPLGVYWTSEAPPKSRPPEFLKSQPLPQSKALIKMDDRDLENFITGFKEYKKRQYDEHSLSTMCFNTIILLDYWVPNTLLNSAAFDNDEEPVTNDQDIIVTTVRRNKWKPQKPGPSLPPGEFIYDWELEPDTTYAVSIRMFDLEYRRKLHSNALLPWVAEKDVSVCPYLTVEFKCSGKGGKQAQAANQAIAAAILWLSQRKDLRKSLGKAYNGLSHFLITIVDSTYVISEARLGADEYMFRQRITGDLTLIADLKLYIEWSNAIHAWGLGANATAFKQDIVDLVELNDVQAASSNLPTPAGTASPMGPPVQKPVI